jgi:hypothetical protein
MPFEAMVEKDTNITKDFQWEGQKHPWVVSLWMSHLNFPRLIKLWKIIGNT